jgi:hypothetical protein
MSVSDSSEPIGIRPAAGVGFFAHLPSVRFAL